MSTEPTAGAAGAARSLPPTAAVAMLTLRLRGASQDADRAEAAERAADHDAARREMRTRLDAMIAERQRLHEATLTAAVEAAAADIDAARRAAAAIAAERQAEAERAAAIAAAHLAEPSASSAGATPTVAPATTAAPISGRAEPFATRPPTPPTADQMADGADDAAAREHISADAGPTTAATSAPAAGAGDGAHVAASPQVMVDAEVLARVFATVFSSMLDERLAAWSRAAAGPAALAPAPPRRRVWSYLRHPDVLLLTLATVICVVVLLSWMS